MSEPNKSFHSVNIFAADTTGCNWDRNYCPQLTIEHTFSDVLFNTCRRFNTDVHFGEVPKKQLVLTTLCLIEITFQMHYVAFEMLSDII